MEPTPELRRDVLRALEAGTKPIEVARKFRLSLVTVGEIAAAKSSTTAAKTAPPRPRRRD